VVDGALGRDCRVASCRKRTTGYFFMNVQLPPAASLERTDEVCRKIERILSETDGVGYAATVAGFSPADSCVGKQHPRFTSCR